MAFLADMGIKKQRLLLKKYLLRHEKPRVQARHTGEKMVFLGF
jgi:hypothetical protein